MLAGKKKTKKKSKKSKEKKAPPPKKPEFTDEDHKTHTEMILRSLKAFGIKSFAGKTKTNVLAELDLPNPFSDKAWFKASVQFGFVTRNGVIILT